MLDIKVNKRASHVEFSASLMEVYHAACSDVLKRSKNQKMDREHGVDHDDNDFSGGTAKELHEALNGERDTSGIEAMRGELKDLAESLDTGVANKSRRKRRFSEHDGDWEHDRQWDMAPFAATHKEQVPTKAINIVVHMATAAGTQARDMDRYGAFLVCLIEQLESKGIAVGVTFRQRATGVGPDTCEINIRVKNPGEYMSTQNLASVFWTNFKRRVGFWAYIKVADVYGVDVNPCLGTPLNPDKGVQSRPGELELSGGNTIPDAEEVLEELKTALA